MNLAPRSNSTGRGGLLIGDVDREPLAVPPADLEASAIADLRMLAEPDEARPWALWRGGRALGWPTHYRAEICRKLEPGSGPSWTCAEICTE